MSRTIFCNMTDSLFEGIHYLDGEVIRHPLRAIIIVMEGHLILHWSEQSIKFGSSILMNEKAIESITNGDTSRFGIIDDAFSLLQVAFLIKISMHDTGSSLNDRDFGIISYKVNKPTTATRNTYIDIADSIEHLCCSLMSSRQKGNNIRVNIKIPQYSMNERDDSPIGIISITTTFQHAGIATLEAK